MILGPDQIVACPRCGALAKHTTLVSGNTLGSRVWTDGKRISPMLPRPPVVVKCHQCAECYWLDQAEKVGTVERRVKEGRRRENLQALVGLLSEEDENDRIMKAEALRQLGEFKSAHQVLGRVSAAEYAEVVRQVRTLCDAGDVRVRLLAAR